MRGAAEARERRPSWTDAVRARLGILWVRLVGLVKDATGRDLPGLGWAARQFRTARVLRVRGRSLFFSPAVASAYGRLVAGQWNEPETHAFLNRMAAAAPGPLHFVDVGASIGAMVLDLAAHPRVASILAFEPHPESAAALRRTIELNGWDHVEVREAALGQAAGAGQLQVDQSSLTASALADPGGGAGGEKVRISTLDLEAAQLDGPALVLIDVEGLEPQVLRGAERFITRVRPVIIFEYNDLSRTRFTLETVAGILGPHYGIWRLRRDGRLDRRYDRAWNCVAVPEGSLFEEAARPLIAKRAR